MDAVVLESNFHRVFGHQICNHSADRKLPQELHFYRADTEGDRAGGQSLRPKPEVASTHWKARSGGASGTKCPPFSLAESSALCPLLPLLGSLSGQSVLGAARRYQWLQQSVGKFGAVPFPDWLLRVVRQAVLRFSTLREWYAGPLPPASLVRPWGNDVDWTKESSQCRKHGPIHSMAFLLRT